MSLAAAMGTLALATSAQAAVIIYMEDFETSEVADGSPTFNSFAGWKSTLFTGGAANELHAGTYGTHLSEIDDAFGSIFNTTLSADLGINFADNTNYTFSFDQFQRDDQGAGTIGVTAQIQTVGGTVLATENFDAVTGTTFSDIANRSVTFSTSGGGEVGQEIRLLFTSTTPSNLQVGIDNISLSVPEPSTTALLGLGGLALILRRRK
ncbi:MAG: PEP-CTERM sorting domain-containing protein [Akkermansiaceae bacterium]|nr:PEP-CTERM sorting domain-containing protein [Akkermansiaceae bacterium]